MFFLITLHFKKLCPKYIFINLQTCSDSGNFFSPNTNMKQTIAIGGKVGSSHLILTLLFNAIMPKVNALF